MTGVQTCALPILPVELHSDRDAPELIVRVARGGTLAGTVLDDRKRPGANVQILIVSASGGESRSVLTGADGRYSADSLAPGIYTVTRQPAGGSPAVGSTKRAEVRPEETTTVDFDGTPPVDFHGRTPRSVSGSGVALSR